MIEFQNVTFTYHSTERESGVYNLNLTIPDGQVVLLCGESGCGKTTLTRLINGLTPEYYEGKLNGVVLVNGNYVKSIVTAQGKMDLERKGKQSYQGWMFARLLAFSNGDLQALYDRSDGFYRRQLVLTTKEKQVDRADDPDLAEKMKAEAEGIFLWAFEGLQRLVANNFKFTESDRIRENREAVKRDNNNIFDFMESEGYIRRKADASISSKDFYEIYRMWCEENSLAPLKARSFSDAMIANARKFNLEHCNNITNSAGRRVWGFMGVEAIARPHINGFYGDSPCTYVPEDIPEEWRQVE